ncbi:MAG: hypothetical protein AAF429_10985 [Pseudomonadota bacterium]
MGSEIRALDSEQATRRYFSKFSRIVGHLAEVAKVTNKERLISEAEYQLLGAYLNGLAQTFNALSYKFLMASRVIDQKKLLSIDKVNSGFPVFAEILHMLSDLTQAKDHLATLDTQDEIKRQMVSHIMAEQSHPTNLQFALSQRIYYELLDPDALFLSQHDPQAIWIDTKKDADRRKMLIHWAVYDSQTNIPQIYFMICEDSGRTPLPRDNRRWPQVQTHLSAQSLSALTLLTIARGFDRDFDDLHPVSLRRFSIGPMYSHAFTEQSGPLRDILRDAKSPVGEDWALTWTVETLLSKDVMTEKTGIFSSAERQIFALDEANPKMVERGLSEERRALIIPHRAYQVLEERIPVSLRDVRKYVVGKGGKILVY